jgi:hypothetical protein
LKFKNFKFFTGHAGQGIDIHGFEDLMPETIESGNPTRLISRIKCCYMLKSAGMFSFCARLGGMIGFFLSSCFPFSSFSYPSSSISFSCLAIPFLLFFFNKFKKSLERGAG